MYIIQTYLNIISDLFQCSTGDIEYNAHPDNCYKFLRCVVGHPKAYQYNCADGRYNPAWTDDTNICVLDEAFDVDSCRPTFHLTTKKTATKQIGNT